MATKIYKELLKELEAEQKTRQKDIELRNYIFHSDIVRKKEATAAEVTLDGLKDFFLMRRQWGNFLRWCLFTILVFNIAIVFAVGMGALIYKDEWFLRLVLTTNLADIIGLVYVVVKFLFSEKSFTAAVEKSTQNK